jgi:phage tail-like protein
MANNTRPIQFRDYLPEVFRADEVNGINFLSTFLRAYEALFEELQSEIEGTPSHVGGVPDLFDPDTTPPPQFAHRSPADFDFLNYLASWIALPLRAEKPVTWNRDFFKTAIALYPQRSTLPGLDALLRAWLKDDLRETSPPLMILTDLVPKHPDVDAVFQLGETATLGVDTVLGMGAPFFFIADLITAPTVVELRQPVGIDTFQRAARYLLDSEKPAHTYYQLRVRAHTMQLAPPLGGGGAGEVYAQIGETTLLWDEPWVFDSD